MLLNHPTTTELKDLLIFHLDKSEFCLDTQDLVKIMEPPQPEILNEQKAFLEIGGVVFNFINLSEIYCLDYKPSYRSKLILLEINQKTVCFLVDKIIEVIASTEKSLESRVFIPSSKPNIKGLIKYEGREILVPDFVNILKKI